VELGGAPLTEPPPPWSAPRRGRTHGHSLTLAQQEGVNNNVVSARSRGWRIAFGLPVLGQDPSSPANTIITGMCWTTPISRSPMQRPAFRAATFNVHRRERPVHDSHAPVGSIVLFVDGSTSTAPRPSRSWNSDVTVSGQDNHLGGPIFLPPLDSDNSAIVAATRMWCDDEGPYRSRLHGVRTLGDVPGWLQSRTAQPVAGTCRQGPDESAERHRASWWERCSRSRVKSIRRSACSCRNTDGLAPVR